MRNKWMVVAVGAGLGLAGCRQDMHDQPRYKPLSLSRFFDDKRASRPEIEGTVARGHLRIDQARFVGKVNGNDVNAFPIPITKADIVRGEERYNIYCSPCHSRVGDGYGQVVRRGFRQPPSYHIQRLKDAPVGHFFDVITNGYGSMPSYASRVAPDDRWRVIAYIRVLQFAEGATMNDVPDDQKNKIEPQLNLPGSTEKQATNGPPEHPAMAPATEPAAPGAKPTGTTQTGTQGNTGTTRTTGTRK